MTRPPLPPFNRTSSTGDVTLTSGDPANDAGFSFHDFSFRDTRRLLLPPLSRRLLERVESSIALKPGSGG